jgi:hypothetical protein
MPYYRELNILLVHIPKTGGSSVERFFAEKNEGRQRLLSRHGNNLIPDPELQKFSLQHQFYSNLYAYRDELGIDFNSNLRVLAIVRNPYHRLISGLRWRRMIGPESSREEIYRAATEYVNHVNLDNHNVPQFRFVTDSNGVLYQQIEIFRTETLTAQMRAHGFVDYMGRETANVYWNCYSRELVELVNDFYQKDFGFFDYPQVSADEFPGCGERF